MLHHARSFFPLDLFQRTRGVADLIWVLDDAFADDPVMPRLLRRLGTVIDIAGLDDDTAAVRLAEAEPDGILSFVDDQIPRAAELAQRLGLRYHTPELARILTDKGRQREALAHAGVPEPGFETIPAGASRAALAELAGRNRFPSVLKPASGMGSRGIRLLEGPEELLELSSRGYDQAIVLGYRGEMSVNESDARTMLTLLTLAKAWPAGTGGPRVVAEMLDRANVAVAQTTGVSDFIVSDELSSLMIAQLSERLELHLVFDELFDADGCFITLNPAPLYAPDGEVAFAEIVAAASARRETALGWRIDATGSVVVNPSKSSAVRLGPKDQVLVLAPR